MRVVLSTVGKFHTFDLARQMERLGALSTIFSGYPRLKLKNERIPFKKIRTFPWLHAPYMRLAPRGALQKLWEWQDITLFDQYVARNMPACDLFCGLSSCGLQSGKSARQLGARYVCDRGSSHIRFQDRILREEYDRQEIAFSGIDPRVIAREEAEYDAADAITVPSTFARETFVGCGVPARKLRLVPYGVDLTTFRPVISPPRDQFNVLFVGSISVRKGVRYLLEAFNKLRVARKYLTLVGSIQPEFRPEIEPLLNVPGVTVLDHMPQNRLKEVMSGSDVMVLPSIEDGFGLVMAQAMACGCPVIASRHTGGADLFADRVNGFLVPVRDSDAIASRLQQLAEDPDMGQHMRQAAIGRVTEMGGWDDYGDKMYSTFAQLTSRFEGADFTASELAGQAK